MFRCDNCGSGYSTRAASSWDSCPRCLARDQIRVPLTFELGWRARQQMSDEAKAGLDGARLQRTRLKSPDSELSEAL